VITRLARHYIRTCFIHFQHDWIRFTTTLKTLRNVVTKPLSHTL
jgi:hypothetical protein